MMRFGSRSYWHFWIGVLVVWTLALVTPGTWFGQAATVKVGEIGVGKILHFAMYALLAGSAGWLPLPLGWRFVIALPLLSSHGALTEFLQTLVMAREGCARDWMIDTAGVLFGLAITWRRWPRSRSASASRLTENVGGRG